MKKTLFTFLVMLMSIVCVFVLMGCPSPENPANPVNPPEPVRQTVSGKIGRYGTPYEVGDIVFTDGSATPAADIESRADVDSVTGTKLTAVEKNALVAYIFYVGNELNNDDDTTTRTIGVGFNVDPYYNGWAGIGAYLGSYSGSVDLLSCSVTGMPDAYSFSGTKNGKDLFAILLSLYPETDKDCFPAFNTAEMYGSAFSSYSDGWYLPTIAELYEVWKKKDDLCAIMGEEYDYGKVVSATQAADAGKCDLLNFSSGEISSGSKTSGNYYAAFAIREFPAE